MTTHTDTFTDPDEAALEIKIDGHIAIVTLSNPKKRNALSHWLLEAITTACQICEQRQVRAMVLTACPQHGTWSAGHDISELPLDGTDPLAHGSALENMIAALRNTPFPVIAQIQGSVWGGAVETVISCDIVIADANASFAMTPANIGLPYNTAGLLHFAERLRVSTIKEMFFTARSIDATEALRLGLVDQLVSAEHIETHVMEVATRIAAKAPLAIAVVKEQLRALSDLHALPVNTLAHIGEIRRRAYQSTDYREGITAFREKRSPVFKGLNSESKPV